MAYAPQLPSASSYPLSRYGYRDYSGPGWDSQALRQAAGSDSQHGGADYLGNQPFSLPPYLSDPDPSNWWANERMRATALENQWNSQFGDQADYYGQGESGYSDLIPQLYGDIWNGGGGYSPGQIGNITQQDRINWQEQNLGQGYLTPEEQSRISGNPYEGRDVAAMGIQGLNGYMDEAAARQRGAASTAGPAFAGITSDLDRNYGNTIRNLSSIVGDLGAGYKSAIDPSRLRMSDNFSQGLHGALAEGRGYAEDPGLTLTPEYLKEAHVSDQEVSDLATSAMRDAAAPYQNAYSRMYTDSAAAGLSPAGTSQRGLQFARASAADMADAANKARLNARTAQRDAAQNIQNTQLNAAGSRAGYGLNYLGQQLGALSDEERLRMGGEQDLSNRLIGAAENTANLRTGNEQFNSGNATNLANFRAGNERYLQDTNIANERALAEQQINNRQYQIGLLGGMTTDAENTASGRAGAIAGNRQGQFQYGNDLYSGNTNNLGSRYSTAYAPWAQAQQEGRAAAMGQQGYWGGRTQDTNQLRLQGWQVGQSGTQGAAQGKNSWDAISKQPGSGSQWFNNIAGLF